jgi:anaerobic dimethyl sulfoxide reductase subunit A
MMPSETSLAEAIIGTPISRRSLLKWSAALGGATALAGGLNFGLRAAERANAAPQAGAWVTAACWHNCGGHRCLNKAFVADGVVIRQKTDDTHPDSPDYPQNRGCARGRSQRHQTFGADRLKYPMKRKTWAPGGGNKEMRGKDEWVRISWDEALDLVAAETKRIKDKYGNESILAFGSEIGRTFTLYGGSVGSWGTTSWGTWYYTGPNTGLGDGLTVTSHNDRMDLRNSQLIVIWGENPAWSSQGNVMYFYQQAKKAGAKFIFIDPLYNDSASVLADDWIPIRPGTDHVLALGIAYTLLKEDDPKANPLIDWDFLNRCTVGFDKDHLPKDADPKDNFQDYLLGTYDGQPKTPEWASAICGVDPQRIRVLAREIGATKRVALLTGWAPARITNGDAWPQMFMTLGCMTGHIGQPGRMTGVSCWEKAANGGPNLINAGNAGVPSAGTNPIKTSLNNSELWDAVVTGKYTAGYKDVKNINVQYIYHAGGSNLNQKVGMTRGIAAHRKVEFVVTHAHFLTTSARYSDIVLPVTTQWERYGYLKGNREILIWASQVNQPLYEAKDDIWIAAELGKRLGLDATKIDPMPLNQQIFNQVKGSKVIASDGKTMDNLVTITAADIAEMGVQGETQTGRISLKEFRDSGQYQVPRAPGDKLGFIALEAFRKDPVANKLGTPSGKLEIHCQTSADFVKSKGWTEIRPIPVYNKPIEGYEDTFKDFAARVKGDYPLQIYSIHYRRRSHSIFDNVPQLREAFPQEFIMNPADAAARGLKHGDIALIRSRHGKVIRPVFVSQRLMPGVVTLGEGAWAELDDATGIDKAGATNTLCGAIPTGQGTDAYNSCNVQVEKYNGTLDPDFKWPQRIVFGGGK